MVEQLGEEISEDEVALYDRQIRLWGVDAQKRLRTSRVLIAGMQGLGAEIAKNVVLAGVKSIMLMDHTSISEEDICSQFLVVRGDLGKNRAECSQSRIQRLNPMVDVGVSTEDVAFKDEAFFKNFDVICMTGQQKDTVEKVDAICRQHNIKFFAGEVFGFFGYMFTDLSKHEYAEEVVQNTKGKGDDGEPQQKKAKLQETKIVKKDTEFVSFRDAMVVDWTNEANTKLLKKLSSSYFLLQVLLQFKHLRGRRPQLTNKENDVAELLSLKQSVLKQLEINTDKIEDTFASSCFAELSPVCAIVGGVLAQEIIKAVTQKDPPHKNFFFYNGMDGSGLVENIGA
jgi:ubiquitin-like 1-activating enzyme E1 A